VKKTPETSFRRLEGQEPEEERQRGLKKKKNPASSGRDAAKKSNSPVEFTNFLIIKLNICNYGI
jgi:hypothetical protein